MTYIAPAGELFMREAEASPSPAPEPKTATVMQLRGDAAPLDPLAQLSDAVTRMAAMMEEFRAPLQDHFNMRRDEKEEIESPAQVEAMLANSPIGPLLQDEKVNDILINGPSEIYVGLEDRLQKTEITFPDKRSLRKLANAIAESVGRHIDPRRPLVDARLKDGSRVNIIAPPMAVNGITMSIRKFAKREITLEKLVQKGEMTQQMASFLKICAEQRVSMLISGGTGTGKTTLLNAISQFIPESERIITIEDTAELRLQQGHVVQLETKEPQMIGVREEEVNASDLVRNALRMRPDRIIVGEIRGDEAFDMVQAMNTGHDGSMATVHANTPRDAFARVENLIGPRMQNMPIASVRRQIVSAITVIIQLVYNSDGKRLVSSITEVVGMEGDVPTMQELFVLRQPSALSSHAGEYRQEWTNIVPHHTKLAEALRQDTGFLTAK